MNYIFEIKIFIFTLVLSAGLTFFVKKIALWLNIIDRPDAERKVHKNNTPLLGGTAIFLSFFVVLFFWQSRLLIGNLEPHHWLGVFVGACFLVIGGLLDDKYKLRPCVQFIFPVLAVVSVLLGGVEIEKMTNPIGGFFYPGIISPIIISLWLLGMMYTTKLLDGLDGLVTGVVAIGAFVIFLFTMTTKYFQPDIGFASLVLSAACLGFLVFNWSPAKIFLGEGGSLFLGYILGVLAIISGGKVAIALLVMGIPIMDLVWTIIRRLSAGKNPFKFADRLHLHFRIFDLGISTRKTVFIYYAFAAIFGLSALFLQSRGKLLALVFLAFIMMMTVIGLDYLSRKNGKE